MNEMVTAGGASPETAREVEALSPSELGSEIRLLTAQARRMALSYGIQIGYRLKVAHEKVGPHGWAEWLKTETDFSAAAASRFEKLYEGYGADQGSLFGVGNKFPTLENISVSNALRLLAVPAEEREEVAAELDAEHISARELEKALAERDEARKQLQDTSARLEQAEKTLAGARDHETELQGKLAAAREDLKTADEEAIREAADAAKKAAEDAAKAELDKLRKKLEKAETARQKAEAEAKTAGERAAQKDDGILRQAQDDRKKAEAEAERARAEAEALRKKLISAESGANVAAALFSIAQQNFNAAREKVIAMQATHPDVAAKLLAGMEMVLTKILEQVKGARG